MKLQRTLPPTVAPISLRGLLGAAVRLWGGSACRDRVRQELKAHFGAADAFLVSSGKAALTVILRALMARSTRRRVVIPAYTCFSVPSAVVKAGVDVVLCDVEPSTLDFNYSELERLLDDRVLCVVSTHLFGHSSDVNRVKRLCQEKGILVVEDAAQAFGGRSENALLGSLGDVSFFSLGRGKNLTCGTGGVILAKSAALAQAISEQFDELEESPRREVLKNWLEMLAMRLFIHPAVYWIPSGLPFLRLGETRFYTDFQVYRMDEVRAHQLLGWEKRLRQANEERISCANSFIHGLAESTGNATPIAGKESVFLRLPVLVKDRAMKQSICRRSQVVGAGLSPNYPATIQEIPELAGRIEARGVPGAQSVVERLVTLPTHRYVRNNDRVKILELFAMNSDSPLATPPTGTDADRDADSLHACSAGHAG